jgi:hypothetical protein
LRALLLISFSPNCVEVGSEVISESIERSAETLLPLLHDAYNSKYITRQRRSIELLLRSLVACRPTDEVKKNFAVDLMESVIETGKRRSALREVAIEAVKKFGPGEDQFFVRRLYVTTDLSFIDFQHRLEENTARSMHVS